MRHCHGTKHTFLWGVLPNSQQVGDYPGGPDVGAEAVVLASCLHLGGFKGGASNVRCHGTVIQGFGKTKVSDLQNKPAIFEIDHQNVGWLQVPSQSKKKKVKVRARVICIKHLPVYNFLGMKVGKTHEYLCHEVSHCLHRQRQRLLPVQVPEAAVAQLHGYSKSFELNNLKDSVSVDQVGVLLLF